MHNLKVTDEQERALKLLCDTYSTLFEEVLEQATYELNAQLTKIYEADELNMAQIHCPILDSMRNLYDKNISLDKLDDDVRALVHFMINRALTEVLLEHMDIELPMRDL